MRAGRGGGPRSRRTRVRRVGLLAVATALALGVGAAPALADAAGPTNFRSVVTDVPSRGVDARIVGGDAFLELRAEPGVEVVIPGYEPDELYLRFNADGTVEVNTRSEAFHLNEARYGARDVDVPADVGAEVPPAWSRVADDGVYAWHDHRIHWMSPTLPPAVDPGRGEEQLVQEWSVPLEIDGEAAAVAGRLLWLPGEAPVTGLAAAAVAFAASWGLAVAVGRRSALAAGAGAAVATTLVVGVEQQVGLPPGAVGDTALVLTPAVGVVVLVLAVLRRRAPEARWLAAGAVVPAVVAVVLQVGALTRPVVPGSLPTGVVRALLGTALGAAAAVMVAVAAEAVGELRRRVDPDAALDR